MRLSTVKTTRRTVVVLAEEDHQDIRMPAEYRSAGMMFIPTHLTETYEEWENGGEKTRNLVIELSGPVLKKDGTPHATIKGTVTFSTGWMGHPVEELPERFSKYTELTFEGGWPWPSTS